MTTHRVESESARQAKRLLVHYFTIALTGKPTGHLDSDSVVEIGEAVDAIIDAAVEQMHGPVTSGPQLCTICRLVYVDTDAGYDTCARCVGSV